MPQTELTVKQQKKRERMLTKGKLKSLLPFS